MNQAKTIFKRNELYEQVWSKPMTKLAKEYGLSDNGLRKICKKLGVPLPPVGYWAKLEFGKEVVQTPLPSGDQYPETYEPSENTKPVPKPESTSEFQRVIDYERKPENQIKVPLSVSRFHPLVQETREQLKKMKVNYMGVLEGNLRCLRISVSPSQLRRALRILNSLISALSERGIEVKLDSKGKRNTTAIVEDQKVYFRISERIHQRPLTSKEIEEGKRKNKWFYETRKYTPSGNLTFKVYHTDYGGAYREFNDGEKQLLEDKLNDIIVAFYRASDKIKKDSIEREEWHKQWIIEQQEREDQERRIRLERRKIDLLFKQAEDWHRAKGLREFIEAVKSSETEAGSVSPGNEIDSWINWAISKAEALDPITKDFLQDWSSGVRT